MIRSLWTKERTSFRAPDLVWVAPDRGAGLVELPGGGDRAVELPDREIPAGEDPAELTDRVHRYHAVGFTEIILMLTGGTVSARLDPVGTASTLAEQVLPGLR